MQNHIKNSLVTIALILVAQISFGQKIIIKGEETNRKLKWSDFTATPNKASSYSALTYYDIGFTMEGVRFENGKASISNLQITLSLNTPKSWSKPHKQTDKLLNHEQGHFDIGILCMYEMEEKMKSLKLEKRSANSVLNKTFKTVLEKYTQLQLKYDEATDHSKNPEKQLEWDQYFSEQLATRNHIQTD